MPAHLEHAARESYGQNFAFRVHHRITTAAGSAGGMCGECVAAPTQQEGMLDTHDTGLTGNPNISAYGGSEKGRISRFANRDPRGRAEVW